MNIGVFEFGESGDNSNDVAVLENTIEYARTLDILGFNRFWLGEHHENGLAWRSPEILMSVIAGYTEKIKVGAAGILLSLNSPLRIAQNFKLLSTLFPDRIDLGLARGITGHEISLELLNGIYHEDLRKNHIQRMIQTINYCSNNVVKIGTQNQINLTIPPCSNNFPEIWVLGSSKDSMEFSISQKTNYSLSLIHNVDLKIDELLILYNSFKKNYSKLHNCNPKTNILISVILGETEKDCNNALLNFKSNFKINLIGNIKDCLIKLKDIKGQFKCDDIILYIVNSDFKTKITFLEEVSNSFNLLK